MKLITGLGNIGEKYCFTRHNTGFMVVDRWAALENAAFKPDTQLKSFTARVKFNGENIILVKPATYMNLSGEAVRAVKEYYKIDIKDIIIIYDDISLDFGRIRLRSKGSDGGHNGIKSVIKNLGSSDFNRIKVGIGPQIGLSDNYVLQKFPKEQLKELKEIIDRSITAAKTVFTDGMEKAQNRFN